MELSSGTVIAEKYRVERKLAVGGMGVVYVATNLATDSEVALKVMDESLRRNAEAARRFIQEAKTAARVRHHGVVRIFDASTSPDDLWIAMELLHGRSLDKRLSEGPLSPDELKDYFGQLLDALKHVHAEKIIHRDLKPANIFLEDHVSGRVQVRLLDFGIAKLSEPMQAGPHTQTQHTFGTLWYTAPEQAQQASDVDVRADIYSLGVILYECLAGHLPYEANSFYEYVVKANTDKPRPLSLTPELARYGQAALACLSVRREERPVDCDELERLLWPPAETFMPALASVPPRHRRTWPYAALGGLVLGLGAVVWRVSVDPARPARTTAARAASSDGVMSARAPSAQEPQGTLVIESELSDVILLIDGRLHGPLSSGDPISIAPGTHTIEARVGDHRIAEIAATVASGERTSIDLPKPELPLIVTTTPPGATVRIDGADVGTTPLEARIEAMPGQQLAVQLRHKGYQEAALNVVADGPVVRIDAPPLVPLGKPRRLADSAGREDAPATPAITRRATSSSSAAASGSDAGTAYDQWLTLAEEARAREDHVGAARAYEKALALRPGARAIHLAAAQRLHWAGLDTEAGPHFRAAATGADDDIAETALLGMAKSAERLGWKDVALATYEEFLRRFPTGVNAWRARERIKKLGE